MPRPLLRFPLSWRTALAEEEGYGIAEAAVALGLLLTVVVPAIAAFLYFTARTGASGPSRAAALVTNQAEVALAELGRQEWPRRDGAAKHGPWRVDTRWTEAPGWAALYVDASRGETEATGDGPAARPAAWIRTGRFVPATMPTREPSGWP